MFLPCRSSSISSSWVWSRVPSCRRWSAAVTKMRTHYVEKLHDTFDAPAQGVRTSMGSSTPRPSTVRSCRARGPEVTNDLLRRAALHAAPAPRRGAGRRSAPAPRHLRARGLAALAHAPVRLDLGPRDLLVLAGLAAGERERTAGPVQRHAPRRARCRSSCARSSSPRPGPRDLAVRRLLHRERRLVRREPPPAAPHVHHRRDDHPGDGGRPHHDLPRRCRDESIGAYVLTGAFRRAKRLVRGGDEVLHHRRGFAHRVPALRDRAGLRRDPGRRTCPASSTRPRPDSQGRDNPWSARSCSIVALGFKVAAVPFRHVDPRRLRGSAHADHRVHGGKSA